MQFKVNERSHKARLDKFLTDNLPDLTRARLQKLIQDSHVLVNGKPELKNGFSVKNGDLILVNIPEAKSISAKPEDIKLNIIFEDKDILVIDKPAGIVVHPSESGGHSSGTIVNAILHHCGKELTGISGEVRPGIVHRLDKDTSGVLVVAKNDLAQQSLMDQFGKREVEKEYITLVKGKIKTIKATIDSPIGRSGKDRKKMAITSEQKGRKAITEYELEKIIGNEAVGDFSLLKVKIKTGRTHQIRVHLNAIGYPVAGDITYGDQKANKKLFEVYGLDRQFLHAAKLIISHPKSGKRMRFESKLPVDLKKVLNNFTR